MKTRKSTELRAVLFSALLGSSAAAVADPVVMLDQGGKIGPKQEAIIGCVNAARANVGDQKGLVFSRRIEMESAGQQVKSITLNATIWEDGERVPIQAKCVSDTNGDVVAQVTRRGTEVVAKVE